MSGVLRFRIELLGFSPSIWRQIEVPSDYSFWDLHVAIQDAMGWTDTHLHAFEVLDLQKGVVEVGIPDPDAEKPVIAGWKFKLGKYFKKAGDRLEYEYDFGDSWRHSIVLEAIFPAEPGIDYPRCLDGSRKCPPEDCGGIFGFEEFLEAISDPDHAQHDDLLDWCGGSFDPEDFDPAEVFFDDPAKRLQDML